MEKIVNMQAQAGMKVSAAIPRQAQNSVQSTKDDFIRLLQQQKESAGQPEEAEDAQDTKDAVKDAEKPEEKQPEKPAKEQGEEPDAEEGLPDLAQMELQQSILQQAVVQIAEPAVSETQTAAETTVPEMTDAVVPDLTQESGELSMEASALPEQPKAEAKPEVKAEPVQTETKADLNPVKAEEPERVTELPREEHQESSVKEQIPQDARAAVPEKRETVLDEGETFQNALTGQDMNQAVSVQTADAPVQAEKNQEVPQTGFQEGEHTVKSTVEELPQELGKAVTAGRPGESQVLQVELEPASLGKLTIRLEYEAGRTMVSVMASNPKTLELLSQKAAEIASILKERTGEETVIYTEQPQKEPGEEAQEQNGRGGQQQERQQRRQEEQPQTDSFMQQLRLGLV